MNTAFLLMASTTARPSSPSSWSAGLLRHHAHRLKAKVAKGEINLPLVWMESSKKGARGVHLNDLAAYIDDQHTPRPRPSRTSLWGAVFGAPLEPLLGAR